MASPEITTIDQTVLIGDSIAASELFNAFDSDGDITNFFVQDFQDTAGSGFFTFDGVAVPQKSFFQVAAEDISRLRYVAGQRGFEKVRITAVDADGNFSSPNNTAIAFSVRENTTAPFSNADSFTVLANETIAGPDLARGFDPDGFPIDHFRIRDRSQDFGFFALNGVPFTQGEFFTVTLEDLPNLTYTSTGPDASELFDVIANDGALDSLQSVGFATTVRNVNRPIVRFSRATVDGNDDLKIIDHLVVDDVDGSTIKSYRFFNTSPHQSRGDLVVDGVVQPRQTFIDVAAADIDTVFYDARNADLTQLIRVQAFDGKHFSAINTLEITSSAVSTLTLRNTVINDGGGPASAGDFILTAVGGANIVGQTVTSQDVPIPIADLQTIESTLQGPDIIISDVNLVIDDFRHTFLGDLDFELISPAGTTARFLDNLGGGQSDLINTVFDDQAATNILAGAAPYTGTFNVNTGAISNPFAAFIGESALGDWTLRIIDEVAIDSGTLNSWGIEFSGDNNNANIVSGVSGSPDVTSVTVGPGSYTLTAAGPGGYAQTVSCTGAADTDATDGLTIASGEDVVCSFIHDDVLPVLSTDLVVISEQLRDIPLSNEFIQTDPGTPIVLYEVFDPDVDPAGGNVTLNGIPVASGVVQQFTSVEFANVNFNTSAFLERNNEQIFVRGNSGQSFGQWTKLDIRTEPEFEDVLDSGSDWLGILPQNGAGDLVISFSFMQQVPDYQPPNNPRFTGVGVDPFGILNDVQRANARLAFRHLETLIDVQFVEVADTSINSLGGDGGVFRLGNYGDPDDGARAFAFFPSQDPTGGDIWFNQINLAGDASLDVGGGGYTTLLHEIGHTLGLKHAFAGVPLLPPSTQFDDFTVLSSNDMPSPSGNPQSFQLYDISQLQSVYGPNEDFNSGDTTYSIGRTFGSQTPFLTIWDGGGSDTLSANTSNLGAVVDLRSGQASSIGDLTNNINIAFDAVIENGLGSANDDQLFGNAVNNFLDGRDGNDFLAGNTGDDFLIGGLGDDTFEFGVGDGFDVIDERAAGGNDRLVLSSFPGFDSLSDDLQFRLNGSDLLVDLNLNQEGSEGRVRIKEFFTTGNEIETLELNGVDIDLVALATQVDSAGVLNRFELDAAGNGSANGLFVTPI